MRPPDGQPGPWDNDVIVYRVTANLTATRLATFDRAGVPTLARLKDGRLIAAHQHFPAADEAGFDKVAVRFSSDEGASWTPPQVIRLEGLAAGMRFPFDPTLVPLPDGRVRLYFTSRQQRQPDVPAIYSAMSTDGVAYVVEPGVRFRIEGRPVIDCAVALHDGVFHVFAPDNGTQAAPQPGQPPPPIGERAPLGVGYHATSRDGLTFARAADVRIDGQRRWLGNAQSDGKTMTFFGTGGGVWIGASTDGASWQVATTVPVMGADPGGVTARDGGWILAVTGPPRPGTPSARGRGPNMPGLPRDGGPRNHRLVMATSKDGVMWTVGSSSFAERASVAELFEGPDGRLIALFVDASGDAPPAALGARAQRVDGSWARAETNLRGADPNVVRLRDGTYRAYTKEPDGTIIVFSSRDGLRWQLIGDAFRDDRYRQATDSDVFETPGGWVMLVSLGPRLLRATSRDGVLFTAERIMDLGGSVSDTVKVAGGWRTFFHVNPSPQTGGKMVIRSAFTADGRTWTPDPGDRVVAPPDGPASLGVADPAPVQLKDGSWLMLLKSFIDERRPE